MMRVRLLGVLLLVTASPVMSLAGGSAPSAAAPPSGSTWFDEQAAASFTVEDGRFIDGLGREVVLRGYNVSGGTKLEENGGLPFASVADAEKSAAALRALGGETPRASFCRGPTPNLFEARSTASTSPPSPHRSGPSSTPASGSTPISTKTSSHGICSTRAAGTRATAPRSGLSRPVATPGSRAGSASSGARTSLGTRP